jgi:hypothetical protein
MRSERLPWPTNLCLSDTDECHRVKQGLASKIFLILERILGAASPPARHHVSRQLTEAAPGNTGLAHPWALFLAVFLLAIPGLASAQVPATIPVGAIRWDAWFSGAPDEKVLAQPAWAFRAPYFARQDATGRVLMDGDAPNVLAADVAYAQAIGIDYFIFGYYPVTSQGGRDAVLLARIDRALGTYLALQDKKGIRFALSLNQLPQPEQLDALAASLAKYLSDPAAIRTPQGRVPVFVLADDGSDWVKTYGSMQGAATAVARLRQVVKQAGGPDLTLILMHYRSEQAMAAARTLGLDMVSTYSNYAPGQGSVENLPDACILHSEAVWSRAEKAGVLYAPNVTLNWDNRPRRSPLVNDKNVPQGPWCLQPGQTTLGQHFKHAADFVARNRATLPFPTIVVYAWNEFTEGGWMVPNHSGDDWTETLRRALGRNRPPSLTTLTWPADAAPGACAPGQADCAAQRLDASWPCPPGTRARRDDTRPAKPEEVSRWAGAWHDKTCN